MKTDPRTRILCLLIFIVCIFVSSSYKMLVFDSVFLAAVFLFDSVSVCYVLKALKKTAFLILVTSLLSGVFSSVKDGIFLFVRMILAVSSSASLTQKITIKQMSDALERLLHSRDLAMIITLSIRFVPVLSEEANRIKEAQTARGSGISGKNPVSRAKTFLPLVIPMFQNAFRRAGQLGEAMEARGYNLDCPKTKMHELKYSLKDAGVYSIYILLLIFNVYTRRYGFAI